MPKLPHSVRATVPQVCGFERIYNLRHFPIYAETEREAIEMVRRMPAAAGAIRIEVMGYTY